MSKAEEVKLHIKAVLNKDKTKLLFVEAGSDFTDVLLSFLALPVGTIVEVLEKHYGDKAPIVGSLNTLYKGIANLDIIYFIKESHKKEVMSSKLFKHKFSRLRLNVRSTQPTSSEPTSSSLVKPYKGVFINSAASFIISDDLRVLPNVAGSIIETLSTLGIAVEDMDGAETINVTFGMNEIIALLKESLISSNPLTALIFPGRQMTVETEKEHVWSHETMPSTDFYFPWNMMLKAVFQKSTNKFLFAQAESKFVDFLFSMLRRSLGAVEYFLGSNTGFKNMDNLHRSVASNSMCRHLNGFDIQSLLTKPVKSTCDSQSTGYSLMEDSGAGQRVVGASMYMVSDDLTVEPLGLTSGHSVIKEMGISFSDIKEVKLKIGVEEALGILKAALISKTALTDGLIKPMLKKEPKKEPKEEPMEKRATSKRRRT